ncbi:MAG: ABC transporter permease, partial [Candidatus Cloacimonetes bacterium]|nr:ABC transporter permease [Candidatus Cloacimonadota bacterium]
MFKNYIRVALRNIGRYKLYSIINILGLAVGIASAIIILLVIQGELQFETHNENLANIYRINKKYMMKGVTDINESTPYPLQDALKEIPEIVAATHLTQTPSILKYEDKVFRETGNVYAAPEIFDIFSFEFVRGSAETAIPDKNSIAISESIAKKYFGDEDPIGKTLINNNRSEVNVTAVFKELPVYTNYNFQIIQNVDKAVHSEDMDDWYSHWLQTFVLLDESADPVLVEQKIDKLMKSNMEEQSGAVLQALKKIHLYDVDGNPTAQKYI